MFGFYHWFKFGFYYFAVASIMEIGSRMETQRKLQIRVFRIGDELDVHLFKKSINKLFNWNSDLLIRWDKLDDAPLFQHWQGCLPNILLTCSLNCSSFFQHLSLNEWPFVCVYIFAPFWHFNLRTGTNKLFFETFAAMLIACFGRAHLFFFFTNRCLALGDAKTLSLNGNIQHMRKEAPSFFSRSICSSLYILRSFAPLSFSCVVVHAAYVFRYLS